MASRARAALVVAAACLLVAACGDPAALLRHSAPHASPSPTAAATPASAPPAACRLPVASGDAPVDGRPADGTAGRGGFVQLPAGTFSPDAASLGAYDLDAARWVPVPRTWLAPDGAHYAWGESQAAAGPSTGLVHVMDAATGADHVVTVPSASAVVSYERDGVYVARVTPNSGAPPQGLTRVDPTSGDFHQVIADGTWTAVGGGYAFGGDVDPSVAPPPAGAGLDAANRVRRLDLQTGVVTTVASYPGAGARVLGVFGSTPVIAVTAGTGYSVELGSATIFSGPGADTSPGAPIVADGTAIWFSSQHGAVWRWDGAGPAMQVATVPLGSLVVAGACR